MKKILLLSMFSFIVGMANLYADMSKSSTLFLQFDKNTIIQKKLKKAQQYIAHEQYPEARILLNGVLRLSPNNARAKSLLGKCRECVLKKRQEDAYNKFRLLKSRKHQSDDISDVKESQSTYDKEEKYYLDIRQGEKAYNEELFYLANLLYSRANDYKTLTGVYEEHYKESKVIIEFYSAVGRRDLWAAGTLLSSLPANKPYYKGMADLLVSLMKR